MSRQPPTTRPLLRVAVGIVNDEHDRILIQRRDEGAFAGLWEFPGGKIRDTETTRAALDRELEEELGIVVEDASRLIRLRYRYRDRDVLLDTWRVTAYAGTASGAEGQPINWIAADRLGNEPLLPADGPIVTALNLPQRYVMTPPGANPAQAIAATHHALERGARLLCWSASDASQPQQSLARQIGRLCATRGARLMIAGEASVAVELAALSAAAGIQVAAHDQAEGRRPIDRQRWLSVAVRAADDVERARAWEPDFVVLDGWGGQDFGARVDQFNVPVFAFGPWDEARLRACLLAGAQGLATLAQV